MNAIHSSPHLQLLPPPRDSQAPVDLLVERARPSLANALRAAEERAVAWPTLFIVRPDRFAGLAFARELLGAKNVDPAGAVAPLVGCESRNVVGCALLAVDNEACRWLLGLSYDEATEVPVVALDGACSVVTISREELLRNGS